MNSHSIPPTPISSGLVSLHFQSKALSLLFSSLSMDDEPKPIVKITTAAAADHDIRKEDDAVPANGNVVASTATATDVASPVADDGDGDAAGLQEAESQPSQRSSTRTPFTDLSQVDADWALARTLQEQERAYMMLRMNNDGSDYGIWESGSYLNDDDEDFEDPDDDDEEDDDESDVEDGIRETYDGTDIDDDDAFDVHGNDHAGGDNAAVEFDPDAFSSDEAFARALQEAEEREMAARMLALAGINDQEVEDSEGHHGNSQDNWEDVDPDELSYEELLALGEAVGTESRGLSADTIASLASVSYKTGSIQHGTNDSCVICRLDYEDGETLTVLSCKHSYHHECINNWLQINKVCPVCSAEVSASRSS